MLGKCLTAPAVRAGTLAEAANWLTRKGMDFFWIR